MANENRFRITYMQAFADGTKYIEAACDSGCVKPEDNFANGSLCLESDTGKVFFYNEAGTEGNKWVPQFTFMAEE